MAVCRQGTYVEYSMEYPKYRALNGLLVSTETRDSVAWCAPLLDLVLIVGRVLEPDRLEGAKVAGGAVVGEHALRD